jgi:hypothetical protein
MRGGEAVAELELRPTKATPSAPSSRTERVLVGSRDVDRVMPESRSNRSAVRF